MTKHSECSEIIPCSYKCALEKLSRTRSERDQALQDLSDRTTLCSRLEGALEGVTHERDNLRLQHYALINQNTELAHENEALKAHIRELEEKEGTP